MDPIIEMLRNETAEIERLAARREEIKRKLEEHRSGNISEEELKKLSEERAEIDKELLLRNKRREELTDAVEKNKNQGAGRGIMNDTVLHFKEGMERNEIFATEEYRSAFFKRLQGKPLTEEEQRAMTSASTSAGAAIPTVTMDKIFGQLKESDTLLGLITYTGGSSEEGSHTMTAVIPSGGAWSNYECADLDEVFEIVSAENAAGGENEVQ